MNPFFNQGGDHIDNIQIYFIPENYKGMVNLLGRSVRRNNLIQAGIFGITSFILSFILIRHSLTRDLSESVGWALVPAFSIGFFCISGIKGQSLLGYLSNMLAYYRSRRTAYFNPRIKREKPVYKDREGQTAVRKLKDAAKKTVLHPAKIRVTAGSSDGIDPSMLYFEDDIGCVEKPYEYMTLRERYQRKKKRRKGHGREKKIAGLRL